MSATTCGPAHGLEVVVLAIGWFNGGTVGIGTVFLRRHDRL
jgi:hypothetical protein